MRSKVVLIFALAAVLTGSIRPTWAEDKKPPAPTAAEVAKSIERGIKFLKSQQGKKGDWADNPAIYHGGLTPLCLLALLNAGCPPDDEAIKRGLTYLRNPKVDRPETTYATSLATMVFCAADPSKDAARIGRNARWLEDTQIKEGPSKGMWSYPHAGATRGDNSNTQFALLALYEAERVGTRVSDVTWSRALDYWKRTQNEDGSWGYLAAHPGTGSMTNAGIASMIIASGQLSGGDAKVKDDRVQCCGEQQPNEPIERALAWFDSNNRFSVYSNPGSKQWLYYYLYGMERTGRMTARRFIGKHDWYREGARMLIDEQTASGSWPDVNSIVNDTNISTSFALLFLAKGRRPVILADLKHGPGDDWDHHRSALFNLVSYVEKSWKRDLTYQVIDPQQATVEDLLETPIVYISGRDAPEFSKEEEQKLRMYVDRGGFIFAEQCCGGGTFDQGFRALMKRVFPESESQLRELPLSHPVWYAEEKVNPKYIKQMLWGVDVGCRTSVVYCPQDLSCYWELARVGREEKYSPAVQQEIEAARGIGINVLAYATNREVKYKLEGLPTPAGQDDRDNVDRGKLYVANVLHGGGCNAAPGALGNLLQLAHDKLEMRTEFERDKIREVRLSDPSIFQYHLLFMHGRTAFRLTPAERDNLRTYLERGGMVLADSVCSSKQFSESFHKEMQILFKDHPLERIPVSHSLFTAEFGGENLASVSRRQPELSRDRDPLRAAVRPSEPYLEGLQLGDRYAVIFSPYDISCALESHESLECEGYVRQDAAKIALNVLLYSLHQ